MEESMTTFADWKKEDKNALIEYLSGKYFLIPRSAVWYFLGGAIAFIALTHGISTNAAKNVIELSAEAGTAAEIQKLLDESKATSNEIQHLLQYAIKKKEAANGGSLSLRELVITDGNQDRIILTAGKRDDAASFVLLDSLGRRRFIVFDEGDNSGVVFIDKNGVRRIKMETNGRIGTPGFNDVAKVSLGSQGEPRIVFYDLGNGMAGITVIDTNMKERIRISTTVDGGPQIELRDSKGEVEAVLEKGPDGSYGIIKKQT